MAVSVVMPALEMAQETGKLVSWLKKEGEQVKKGEMLLEVETDKAVVEIEAAQDGEREDDLAILVPLVRAAKEIADAPNDAGDLGMIFSGHGMRCLIQTDAAPEPR